MKKILAIALSALLVFSLAGCEDKKKNPEGDIIRYTKKDIPEGYFIARTEGDQVLYYPFLDLKMEDNGDSPFFWFTKKFEPSIPKIGKSDQIVYKSFQNRPNSYRFLALRDFGYTIGATLNYETYSDGAMSDILVRFSGRFCPYSPIEGILGKSMNLSSSTITEINGKPFREIMISPEGFVKGLDPQAMYRIGYYNGTVYNSADVMSDTRAMIAEAEYVSRSFTEDKDSLFLINMPAGMRDGFYYLEGGGLFEWVGDSDDLIQNEITPIKDPKKEEKDEEDSEEEEQPDIKEPSEEKENNEEESSKNDDN